MPVSMSVLPYNPDFGKLGRLLYFVCNSLAIHKITSCCKYIIYLRKCKKKIAEETEWW